MFNTIDILNQNKIRRIIHFLYALKKVFIEVEQTTIEKLNIKNIKYK